MLFNILNNAYRKLGLWISRHSNLVIVLWAAILVIACMVSRRAPGMLDAASRPLEGTPSYQVEQSLGSEFEDPFVHSLALVLSSSDQKISDSGFQKAIAALGVSLARCPGVAKIIVPDASFGQRFSGEGR
jgi:uncharacterized membrane protein YdfJ with MMPL/SSD domain